MDKKILGQVLRILAAVSMPANEGVNGTTVAPIQTFKRISSFFVLAGGRYQDPLRGFEVDSLTCGGAQPGAHMREAKLTMPRQSRWIIGEEFSSCSSCRGSIV